MGAPIRAISFSMNSDPIKYTPRQMATVEERTMTTVFHSFRIFFSLMVVPICTSSRPTLTLAKPCRAESVKIVAGRPFQKPMAKTTEATKSMEMMALVFVAIMSPSA